MSRPSALADSDGGGVRRDARSSLHRQLRWYIAVRLVAMASVSLPYYWLQLSDLVDPSLPPASFFAWLFGAALVATAVYLLLLRPLDRWPQVHAYAQFFGDLVFVSLLVHRFGGISPFSPFYLIIISIAAVMLGQRASLVVAGLSITLYAGLILGLSFGWLEPPPGSVAPTIGARVIYTLLVHFFGFFAVARLTALLSTMAERARQELAVQREDLAALRVVHRDVIESIPSGIATTDLDGTLRSLNEAGRRILGLQQVDPIGHPIHHSPLFSPLEWQQLIDRSSTGAFRAETEIERNGETAHIGFSISPLRDAAGEQRGYILIFQDLTRWRELEEELRLKDRMAAVGELAAGIAHEIGNPLAAISGSVQMLSQSGERTASEHKLLGILLKESQRLDRTIKGFLRFARQQDSAHDPFDIAALLIENAELLSNSDEVSEDHEIVLDIDPPSVMTMGIPDQISQIFWNLARNGLKAMPDGGTLVIRGRPTPAGYRFEFSDTGRGMTEEEKAKLFHPFQSFFDSGTGIGMAIVYRIVQEHGGHVRIDSAVGRGTRIVIELPAAVAEAMEAIS